MQIRRPHSIGCDGSGGFDGVQSIFVHPPLQQQQPIVCFLFIYVRTSVFFSFIKSFFNSNFAIKKNLKNRFDKFYLYYHKSGRIAAKHGRFKRSILIRKFFCKNNLKLIIIQIQFFTYSIFSNLCSPSKLQLLKRPGHSSAILRR